MFNQIVDHMLDERQVFEVIRIEDNTFICVHYTRKAARIAKLEYELDFDEPCRIARSFICGGETISARKKNDEE